MARSSVFPGKLLSATQLVFTFLGYEQPAHCACIPNEQPCWVCGHRWATGIPVDEWSGDSFTGQNKVLAPFSGWICSPCVVLTSRVTPVPGREPGPCSKCRGASSQGCAKCSGSGKNKFGGNWRNYSVCFDAGTSSAGIPDAGTAAGVVDGGLTNTGRVSAGRVTTASKAEKPVLVDFLRSPREGSWVCAVAISGQKHVLPWAPVNPSPGAGTILMEETVVRIPGPGDQSWSLLDRIAELVSEAVSLTEVSRGDYLANTWRCPRRGSLVRAFERDWGWARHGPWFTLCLFLTPSKATLERGDDSR